MPRQGERERGREREEGREMGGGDKDQGRKKRFLTEPHKLHNWP